MSSIGGLIASSKLGYLDAAAVRRNGVADYTLLLTAVEQAYLAHARGDVRMPKSEYLKYPDRPSYDRIIPLLGYVGKPYDVSGLKQICSSTGNQGRGLPRASGLIILNDPDTSRPFAVLEASQISAARTAAVTGLGLRELADPAMRTFAIFGCGQLAEEHLAMIAQVFGPARFSLQVWDPDAGRLRAFVGLAERLGIEARSAAGEADALADADIVLTATTAEQAHISLADLKGVDLYLAVSLLDAALDIFLAAETILVDDLAQCLHEGRPLEVLANSGRLPKEKVVEMGSWLTGERRPAAGGLRVFNPMGTVITDLAVAKTIFDRALAAGDVVWLQA